MARTSFSDDFRRNFLTGVAALFPIILTLFLFSWLYRQIDGTLGEGANAVCQHLLARFPTAFGLLFPGASGADDFPSRLEYASGNFPPAVGTVAGLIVVGLGVYLLGRALRGYIGRRAMRGVDRFFERFPIIKTVYPYARQLGDLVFGQRNRRVFSRVVAVQYPREGLYSVGFLTGSGLTSIEQRAGRELLTVFVPTSPTPLTGFIVLVPPEDVMYLDMSVDEAFRYFLTAGMLASQKQRPEEVESGP